MPKETVDTLSRQAQEALARGDNDRARELFQRALGQRSDLPDVHYGLATVCFLLNDLASAAYHFREVTRLDPLRAGAYVNLGAVYNRLDQLDDAVPMLKRGIQLDSGRAEGYYNLGLVYRRLGKLEDAIEAYRQAVKANPRMADAHFNIANIYLEQGHFSQSVLHYQHALQVRPTWEKAQHGLENAQAALEDAVGEDHAGEVEADARMQRHLDPAVHGNLLSALHKTTIDAESQSRALFNELSQGLEPAMRQLLQNILDPNNSSREIQHWLELFEKAAANFRTLIEAQQARALRVRLVGEQMLKL